MLATLTWLSLGADSPEILTVDLPRRQIEEMQQLIGTPEWAQSMAVAWIPVETNNWVTPRLFCLSRITAIEPRRP